MLLSYYIVYTVRPLRDQDTGGEELSLFETYITEKKFQEARAIIIMLL